jgi:hypothetical protein
VGYILRIKPLGAPDWEIETPVVGNSYVFNSLEACTEYEVNLITICQNKLSDEGILIFKTACSTNLETPSPISALRLYPNPFQNNPSLEFNLNRSGRYLIHCFDARGTLMHSEQRPFIAGQNVHQLNWFDRMPSGLYLLSLTDEYGENSLIRLVKQ